MKIRYVIVFACTVLLSVNLFAQEERKDNRKAVKAMGNSDYNNAVLNFQKAMKLNPEKSEFNNNLGHAQYRNENYEAAANNYLMYGDKTGFKKADNYYNLGNSMLQAGEYDKSIKSYIQALKMDPHDAKAKYNLSMANAMLRQQQQQQKQQQKDNKDQNKDQKKDKDKDKDKDKKQDQNKDQKNKQDQKQKPENQKQQEKKLSKEDAERILQALQKKEEDLQDDMNKKALKANSRKPEKDW
jgi:tetratricopeptide (TPR) repeat protein